MEVIEPDTAKGNVLHLFVAKQVSRLDEYRDQGLPLEFHDRSSPGVPVKVSADFSCADVSQFWGPSAPAHS
jgi:hypothetical protein